MSSCGLLLSLPGKASSDGLISHIDTMETSWLYSPFFHISESLIIPSLYSGYYSRSLIPSVSLPANFSRSYPCKTWLLSQLLSIQE
jgi:hypothetical protein